MLKGEVDFYLERYLNWAREKKARKEKEQNEERKRRKR